MADLVPAEAGPEGGYQPLPSRKLLTDLVADVEREQKERYEFSGAPHGFPSLATLWVKVNSTSKARLQDDPEDPPARDFQAAWRLLDSELGDPLDRAWHFTWSEAHRRFQVLNDYLNASGLLNLGKVEADAPEHFFSREELGY